MITIHPDTLEQMRKKGVKDDVIADEMAKANPHFASQVTKIRKKFGGDPAATTAFLNTRFYGVTDHTPDAPKGLLGRSLERIYQNYQKDTLDIAKATQQKDERFAAAGGGFGGFSEKLNAKTDQFLQTAGNAASIIASPISQPLTEALSTAGKAVYDSVPGVKNAVQQVGQSNIVQKGVIPAAQAVASEAERNPALQSLAAVAEGSFDALDAAGVGMAAKPVTNTVVSGVEQLGKATVSLAKAAPSAVGQVAGVTARGIAYPFVQGAKGFMQGIRGQADDVAKAAVNQADDAAQELVGSAKEAVRAGMDEKLMRFAASQNADTRSAMAQMTRLAKKGAEKLGGDTAHKEVLGGYMMNNMSHILETKQSVGKALGAMKMGMKNEVIDLTDDYASLMQSLVDKGAVINGKGQITKLMGASDDNIPLLQQALDFLQPDDAGRVVTTSGKADMWRTKMFQEMNSAKAKLQPSSSGQSSLGFAEKVVNDLRRGAIKKMAKNNSRFLAYNDAFENLSTEASKFLKTIGYKGKLSIDDITAKELRSGEIALRTLGNASADTRDAFTSMLQTARKYGYSSNVDEMQLIRWADALEDVFPITPSRSLQGAVSRGTRDSAGNMIEDVVRSGVKPGAMNRAADAIIDKIDAMRGITPENRFKLLMDVLEAPPETSFFQIAKKALPDGMVDDLGKIQGIDAGDIAPAARAKIQTMNEDNLPLSSFSPQGVKDAAKMDELVKGGMTPQQAAKSLNDFPDMTPDEIVRLTPEEKATGLIGGSDSANILPQLEAEVRYGMKNVNRSPKDMDAITALNKEANVERYGKEAAFQVSPKSIEPLAKEAMEYNYVGFAENAVKKLERFKNKVLGYSDSQNLKGDFKIGTVQDFVSDPRLLTNETKNIPVIVTKNPKFIENGDARMAFTTTKSGKALAGADSDKVIFVNPDAGWETLSAFDINGGFGHELTHAFRKMKGRSLNANGIAYEELAFEKSAAKAQAHYGDQREFYKALKKYHDSVSSQ